MGTGDFIALTQSKEAGEVCGVYRCRVWNMWTWQETYSDEAVVKIELTCTRAERSGPFGYDHRYKKTILGNPVYQVSWIAFEFKGGTPPYDVKVGYTRKVAKYSVDQYGNASIDSFWDSNLKDVEPGKIEIKYGKDWINVILSNAEIWAYTDFSKAGQAYEWYITPDSDPVNFFTYHVVVTDAMGQKTESELNCADGVFSYNSEYGHMDKSKPSWDQ